MTQTDRALTWAEWHTSVVEACSEPLTAIIRELADAEGWLHPLALATLRDWQHELHAAVADADPARFDRWLSAIRAKLAQERAWAAQDEQR